MTTEPTEVSAPQASATQASAPQESGTTTPPTQKRHEEYQYLDLVREILDEGEHRPDR